jgi:ABC-type spermidine/putrescine transport system permease subunit II
MCKYCLQIATITKAAIEIVLKIFSLFFGHFYFVVVYAKTIIHVSDGDQRKDIHLNASRLGEYPCTIFLCVF